VIHPTTGPATTHQGVAGLAPPDEEPHTMNDTDQKREYEVTHNPVDGTYGFVCLTHGIHRAGITQRHALNIETKHRRTYHRPPIAQIADNLTVDLTAAAVIAGSGYIVEEVLESQTRIPVCELWEALTGLDRDTARDLTTYLVGHTDHHTAAVVPL
jgi:hypothetical protein